MCKPVWLNVKRTSLMPLISRQIGAVVADPSFLAMHEKMTILDKREDENGWLIIVSYLPAFYKPEFKKTVVAAFWCPFFGGGGWVDLPKDPKTLAICKEWEAGLEAFADRMEREAQNCMAL